LRSWHPIDYGLAGIIEHWFAVGPHFRHAHFDQAHPAISGGSELLVIAIARNITSDLFAGLDQSHPFRKLMPNAIDLDVDHRDGSAVGHEKLIWKPGNLKIKRSRYHPLPENEIRGRLA